MEESSKPLIQRGSYVCPCGGGGGARGDEVVPRGGTEDLVVDLEKGQQKHQHRHGRHREDDSPPVTVADMLFAPAEALFDFDEERTRTAAEKAANCILRGLVVLLWVYMVDWMRRYVTTHSTEELMLSICPLGTLVTAVSVFFCLLMGYLDECKDEHTHPTNNSTEYGT